LKKDKVGSDEVSSKVTKKEKRGSVRGMQESVAQYSRRGFKELEESSRLLGIKLKVLAIGSTGLREDNASYYYAKIGC